MKKESFRKILMRRGEESIFRWIAVLDALLLQRIWASFYLCQGTGLEEITLDADYDYIEWKKTKPTIKKILKTLNSHKELHKLYNYQGNFKVIDESNNTLSRRPVEIGKLARYGVLIKSGLAPGEWIVVKGVHSVREGEKVQILDVARQGRTS